MRVVVDRRRCTGLGHCEVAAPAVFAIDDGGDLVIGTASIAPDQVDAVRTAIQRCPTEALQLIEK